MSKTSERHTGLLNDFAAGTSMFHVWAKGALANLVLDEWSYGRLAMTWRVDERFIMPDGIMFGGHIAAVADVIASLAAYTVLEENDDRFRTSQLETSFFRPITKVDHKVEAIVSNVSRSLIHLEATVFTPGAKPAVKIGAVQVKRKSPSERGELYGP